MASRASGWAGVIDVVPGMNNLTLVFGPQADAQALTALLRQAWEESGALIADGKRVDIEVAYGGDDGPDLRDVAAHTGLSPAEVVRRHTAPEYIVYFLGFQPGFAYMGGLDKSLATPRRAEPRMAVPAGSVGIGGEQTGIYPATSPVAGNCSAARTRRSSCPSATRRRCWRPETASALSLRRCAYEPAHLPNRAGHD